MNQHLKAKLDNGIATIQTGIDSLINVCEILVNQNASVIRENAELKAKLEEQNKKGGQNAVTSSETKEDV